MRGISLVFCSVPAESREVHRFDGGDILKKEKSAFPRLRRGTADDGGLAQLARAPALQAGGHRFDSDILHEN